MEREPIISKYWVWCSSAASGSSSTPSRLTPSTSCCATPSTSAGISNPAAAMIVGMRSTACANWERTAPGRAMRPPQWTMSGVRVPPSQV